MSKERATTGTGYIIVKKEYEYNDEIYHTTEGESGTPVRVFTDRQQAEVERKKLELEEWRDCEVSNYAYDITELSSLGDKEEIEKALSEVFLSPKEVEKHDKQKAALEEFKAKQATRSNELRKVLSGTLKGRALDAAITGTLEQEGLGKENEPEVKANKTVDLDYFTVPSCTEKQLEEIAKVFDNLSFYEIVEVPLD